MDIQLSPAQIGELNEDGSIRQDVDGCAISGRPVLGYHGVMYQISPTQFVRVLQSEHHHVTDEWLTALRERYAPTAPKARRGKAAEIASDTPRIEEEMTDGN